MRAGCLWGACCKRLREELSGPFPADVPFVSVFSRSDSVVDWRASLDLAARHVEVACTHAGLISEPEALAVIGEELHVLRQPEPRSRTPSRPGPRESRPDIVVDGAAAPNGDVADAPPCW